MSNCSRTEGVSAPLVTKRPVGFQRSGLTICHGEAEACKIKGVKRIAENGMAGAHFASATSTRLRLSKKGNGGKAFRMGSQPRVLCCFM